MPWGTASSEVNLRGSKQKIVEVGPVSNQSLSSESVASSQVDSTSVDKATPETEDLHGSVSDTAQQPSEEQSKSLEKKKTKKPNQTKQNKNRCFMCRKKVELTGFECWCGSVYCAVHRYSDVHNCSHNYKADAAEKNQKKENPVVVGEKIQKI